MAEIRTGDDARDQSAWSGRLAIGPWWFLYSGPVGPTKPHAHHAFQIVVHEGSPVVGDGAGKSFDGPVVVLDPEVTHAFRDYLHHVAIVFVDPESVAGINLRRNRVERPLALDAHQASGLVGYLRPDSWSQAEDLVRRVFKHLCGSVERSMEPRGRHSAVEAALARLPELVREGAVDVKQLANEMGLSASRLSHVFAEEIGTPIRSYVRWLRLVNAAERLATGTSITQAAHDAGFADGPHFTRTFRSMFGLAPSEAVSLGDWLSPEP